MNHDGRDAPSRSNLPPGGRKLRLSVVTETFPPEVNGVAQTLLRLVQGLERGGHDLTLVRPRQQRAPDGLLAPGTCEVLVPGIPLPRYPQLRMGFPSRRRLMRLWQARRPDVVHLVTEGPLGLSALLAARRLGLPVCSDFRTNFHSYSRHFGIGALARPIFGYLRWFHNRTRCTMVPTHRLAAELATQGFRDVRVVARGVDTGLFDPGKRCDRLRASWGATPETLVALYVGRIAPEKNLPAVFAAFRRIHQVKPNSRLVLVGDGPAADDLRSRCPEAVFAGVRKGEELARHYASADLFLFASLTETFGNVTLEAMASGLPVLAYDHAAAGEVIRSGTNGVLARAGNEPELVALAARLAGHAPDLARLGRAARRTVLDLDWSRILEEVEGVYRSFGEARAASPLPTSGPAPCKPYRDAENPVMAA